MNRWCHFATGCRTECIIRLQCWSSELLPFSTVNWPIRCLDDFPFVWVSYTETRILLSNSSAGNSGRGNMRIWLKTVTWPRSAAEVFWCRSLRWLYCTLILAYRAAQGVKHGESILGSGLSIEPAIEYLLACMCYLPVSECASVGSITIFSRPTSNLWAVGRNFKERSTCPTRSCGEIKFFVFILINESMPNQGPKR